ncbi:MAG TPA: NmrA family NAD(P)-binding protein [Thermoanaerobaculia bacterium]|nr:NmrA family NAD(P)-binding protein [Thermoanaerobaculia bacterium]
MNERTILVTGATGQQGGSTANELLELGFRIRALTRKPNDPKARALAERGAEIVQGDFDDPPSIERALAGVDGIFAVQNTWEAGVEGEEAQGKRMVALAKDAGIRQYVYTSVGSAHRNTGIPHFDNKWRVEETVRGAGFPSYTIFRPVFFMDNFLSPWFLPGIQEGKLRMGIDPATRLQMIAVRDIGKFVVKAFTGPEEMNRREIDLAGDERTGPETAKVLSRVLGRSIEFERVPIEQVRAWSEDYALMLEWFDRVGYDVVIEELERELGVRTTKLEEWAASVTWD